MDIEQPVASTSTISTEEANVTTEAAEQEPSNQQASRPSSSSVLTLDTQGFLDDTYNAVR